MAQFRRVAYVIENPLDERDFERYGMRFMRERGIELYIVDVTAITRPHWRDPRALTTTFTGVEIARLTQARELRQAANKLAECDLIITLVGFTGTTGALRVYRAASRSGTPYLVLSTNAYPGHADRPSKVSRWIGALLQRVKDGQINLVASAVFRTPPKLLGISPADFAVLGGSKSRAGIRMYPTAPSTREIAAHSMDYELYRGLRSGISQSENIAVFIDENVGFQRDLQDLGIVFPIDVNMYYDRLRRLFDRVEGRFGLSVVIAANPRSEREKRTGFFGDRRVEYGATARLVGQSRLVIAHRSTAIGLAVMFAKPVLFVMLRDLYHQWTDRAACDAFSEALSKPIQFFDDPDDVDLEDALWFDARRYESYMASYVKQAGSPEQPFWEIVWEAVTGQESSPAPERRDAAAKVA